MKNLIATSACLGIIAAALVAAAPVRADVGLDDLNGTAVPSNVMGERTIMIGEGMRWVNVDYGQTVEFAVTGKDGNRRFVWRFDGIADRVNLNDIDRAAAMSLPIYVNQTPNLLHGNTGGGD